MIFSMISTRTPGPQLTALIRVAARILMSSLTVSASSSPHVDRTKDSTRSDVVSSVMVLDIRKLSPTVKGFTLHVEDNSLKFKSGQWVDLSIPSEDVVGGYSFTSPPHQLIEQGTVTLAIQTSDHPPTLWMNNKCEVGDRLSIRVGGDFTYDPPSNSPADILLIGGGVGINPLFSILQHHAYLQAPISERRGHAHLLYSARSREELLFKDHIDGLVHSGGLIKVNYFVTGEENSDPHIIAGRMVDGDVRAALSLLDTSRLQCYVCGPPPMTEGVLALLISCGVDRHRVFYEKWW